MIGYIDAGMPGYDMDDELFFLGDTVTEGVTVSIMCEEWYVVCVISHTEKSLLYLI